MGVSSETLIMNSALVKMGAEMIFSADDDNNRARLMKQQYPLVRDSLLRSHPWNFNKAYQILAPISPLPAEIFGFQNVFQLPADCVRVLGVNLHIGTAWEQIEGNRIAANADTLTIKFGRRVTDTNQFDDSFVEVCAWALATDLAYSITQSSDMVKTCQAGMRVALMEARSFNAQVGSTKQIVNNDWLNSRRY